MTIQENIRNDKDLDEKLDVNVTITMKEIIRYEVYTLRNAPSMAEFTRRAIKEKLERMGYDFKED